jgi:hypothetical protein
MCVCVCGSKIGIIYFVGGRRVGSYCVKRYK